MGSGLAWGACGQAHPRPPHPFPCLRVVRLFRLLRLFRIAARLEFLAYLFDALLVCLPAIANLLCIFLGLLFIYASIGKYLFGGIRFQGHLNRKRNFRNFGEAAMTMVQCLTLDDWGLMMQDCGLHEPWCTRTAAFNDCSPGCVRGRGLAGRVGRLMKGVGVVVCANRPRPSPQTSPPPERLRLVQR